MGKIIAAGHICLDITPVFPGGRTYGEIAEVLMPGKLIQTEAADVHTGGSVANTGLALKRLGNDVILLGKIGEDAFGSLIVSILEREGAGGLIVDPCVSTSYSVVLNVPGIDRLFLHNPGANDTFSGEDIPESALEEAELFHFGYPTVMKRMYENGGAELAAMFRRVKAHGLLTSLDLSSVDPDSDAGHADWEEILGRVLPYVDFFVPSFEELCFMLDRPRYERLLAGGGDMAEGLDLEKEAAPLAGRVLEMGCRAALIKCGTSGMYYRTAAKARIEEGNAGARFALDADVWSGKEGKQACYRPDRVLSGTGAGDTSIAAFLTAVLKGKAPEACVSLAAAEGACCVTAYDALTGLKTIPELEARLRSGWETL